MNDVNVTGVRISAEVLNQLLFPGLDVKTIDAVYDRETETFVLAVAGKSVPKAIECRLTLHIHAGASETSEFTTAELVPVTRVI